MTARRKVALRTRLALISALAVAASIALASGLTWAVTSQTLRTGVDRALITGPIATSAQAATGLGGVSLQPEAICGALRSAGGGFPETASAIRLLRPDGSTCATADAALVYPTAADRRAAAAGTTNGPYDATSADGRHVRIYTIGVTAGYAVLSTRDLTEVDATLRRLGLSLLVITGLGCLAAFGIGLVVARAGLRPINRLTGAAEHVAATLDLDQPMAVAGNDEVARLARAFNAMTDALTAARRRQQQLVADASHELRTPLTSLRTNIDLLIRSQTQGRPLPPDQHQQLLTSVHGQLLELTQLVSELTVLAHPQATAGDLRSADGVLRFDQLVAQAITRARRRGTQTWQVQLQPWTVTGDAVALERAVLNILDNAVKFSPPESIIRVQLQAGECQVDDQGPGINPADRTQAFDRFWRSPAARSLPGSGLGLAIVADAIAQHRGTVRIEDSPTGGTRVIVMLPRSTDGREELRLTSAQAVSGDDGEQVVAAATPDQTQRSSEPSQPGM
jgi:two-component system, OmpR family, sensor histidine kinase MprB